MRGGFSKRKLQAELNNPHRSSQAADFAIPRSVRYKRINILEADAGGSPEIRRVGEIEKLAAKLQTHVFPHLKILVGGEIQVPLARRVEDRLPGISIMTKVRTVLNVA